MASWQAHALNGMFRFFMKRHGDKPIDLERSRTLTRKPAKRALHIPEGWHVEEIVAPGDLRFDIADRRGRPAAPPQIVTLYLHGGGYFFGSPKTHRQIILAMARATGGPCYGLDYRLAPEHRFPAAVEDATAAYVWLARQHPRAHIVIAGDSAGGGLGVVTALAMRDAAHQHRVHGPAALVLFSPWTDLAVTGASVDRNARACSMFTPNGIRQGAQVYLGDSDPRDPRASPLYAELGGLPPMLVFASRHELLLDDAVRLADKARAAGVAVELVLRDRLPHVWPIFLRLMPEGREALAHVRAFLERVLAEDRRHATPRIVRSA